MFDFMEEQINNAHDKANDENIFERNIGSINHRIHACWPVMYQNHLVVHDNRGRYQDNPDRNGENVGDSRSATRHNLVCMIITS